MFDEAVISKFWARVERRADHECWPWRGVVSQKGYGRLYLPQRATIAAHRFSYQLANGPIPRELVMDHLCRNRACVNPAHLQAVDNTTNVMRGVGLTAINARMTHCRNGHPLAPARLIGGTMRRECVPCKAARDKVRNDRSAAIRALGKDES